VRCLHLAILALFVAARITFGFQDPESAGMSFLSLGLTLLLAAIVFIAFAGDADLKGALNVVPALLGAAVKI
jgi:F0F1-type ATP synthase assembly protein I